MTSTEKNNATGNGNKEEEEMIQERLHPKMEPESDKAMTRSGWNGAQLAREAENDGDDEEEEEDEDEDDLEEQDKLLEDLLRLRLNPSLLSDPVGVSKGPMRILHRPYQTRTKMEQFEDILMESQLFMAGTGTGTGSGQEEGGMNNAEYFGTTDFETSDAIFNEAVETSIVVGTASSSNSSSTSSSGHNNNKSSNKADPSLDEDDDEGECSCSVCSRDGIQAGSGEEVKILRECWAKLRKEVSGVYKKAMNRKGGGGGGGDHQQHQPPGLESPEETKDRVHRLCQKDPHQLFQRLETVVTEVVLEVKVRLLELLQKQAKDPGLAQDFIQELLDGYENLCSASQHLAPALIDLELHHLRRFSLTWEVLNKRLYQSIIYSEPLIQNNLPIFISQLRSLFPDKEHEAAKYTKLVRSYLDFDVDMENIGELWKASETMLAEYNQQQSMLRSKQKMLKEDWERFKAQKKEFERQMLRASQEAAEDGDDDSESHCCLFPSEIGESLNQLLNGLEDFGLDELPAELEIDLRQVMELSTPEDMSLMLQHQADGGGSDLLLEEAADLFSDTESVAAFMRMGMISPIAALRDEADDEVVDKCDDDANVPCNKMRGTVNNGASTSKSTGHQVPDPSSSNAIEIPLPATTSSVSTATSTSSSCSSNTPSLSTEPTTESVAKLCQAYSSLMDSDSDNLLKDILSGNSGLAAQFPSLLTAEGLKSKFGSDSGKMAAELSEALSTALNMSVNNSLKPAADIEETATSAAARMATVKLTSDNVKATKPSTSSAAGCAPQAPEKAPPSSSAATQTTSTASNPSKASASSAKAPAKPCKGHHGKHAKELNKLLQQHYCNNHHKGTKAVGKGKAPVDPEDSTAEEMSDDDYDDSITEDSCSSSTASNAGGNQSCSCCYCEVFGHGGPSLAPVSRNYPEMRERLRLLLNKKRKRQNANKGGQQPQQQKPPQPQVPDAAKSAAAAPIDKGQQQQQQQTHVQPSKAKAETVPSPPPVVEEKDVDELLDFIEGNQSRPANEKKRAKKERQRQQRLEEQRRREEEERKRKAAIEAERKRREAEERKAREMAEQMAKKQKKKAAQRAKKAAAKGLPPPDEQPMEQGENPAEVLERLRLKQIQELQQLQMLHQKQLEEEQRKVKGKLVTPPAATPQPAYQRPPIPKAGPQQQIKITRTPSGGVEFTPVTVPATAPAASVPPTPSQTPMAMAMPAMMPNFAAAGLQPQIPAGQPFPYGGGGTSANGNNSVPVSKPPLQANSQQPMVTIRRVQNPHSVDEPTVTISMKEKKKDKLLYTLVNGQVHKAAGSNLDLIPGVNDSNDSDGSNLSKKQRKKLRQQARNSEASSSPAADEVAPQNHQKPQQQTLNPRRAPLPVNTEGKLDLDRMDLPTGISITKIEGPVPERKFYPSKPEAAPAPQTMPMPGQPMMMMPGSGFSPGAGFPGVPGGYPRIPGTGAGGAGSNVIVVDTSSLKTRSEEEDDEKKGKKGKKNKKKKPQQQSDLAATTMSYDHAQQVLGPGFMPERSQMVTAPPPPPPVMAPPPPPPVGMKASLGEDRGSLKKGPQVLIKNVNGKVVITPIPETRNDEEEETASNNNGICNNNQQPSCDGIKGGNANNRKNSANGKIPVGENMDEINSIFAPKDIDLDNGEIDDDERELEAFKRFCFNSVPLQQKAKVNFDVKNIAFKRK